jgi:hypothetical protein
VTIGSQDLLRVADKIALYTLESVTGQGDLAHREAIIVAYLTLHILEITYPRRSAAEIFSALQEAEGMMTMLSGPQGIA